MRRLIFPAALAVAGAELLLQWARIWTLAPDLAWGWAVPILVGYFLWSRWQDRPEKRPGPRGLIAVAIVLALTIFPFSRLLLEPFPGWPLAEWMHSAAILLLILALIAADGGAARARHFAWPLVFGLSALPWPAFIAAGAIGHLRIGLAALVTEALNFMGEPAMSNGTVIQVGAGYIGIDEACGGIRSLQAAVMVALAIGELRRETGARRLRWIGLGIALALLANLLRIGALALICARAGMGALALWHDRVAALEMILVLGGLAAFALAAGVPPRSAPRPPSAEAGPLSSSARALAIFTLAIIGGTEIFTLAWFALGDARERRAPRWEAHLPALLPSYSADPFTPVMQDLLRCDGHQLGHWSDGAGGRRAGFVIDWRRGHAAQYAVRLHNPDICLDLAGSRLVRAEPDETIADGPFELPFSVREFQRAGEIYHVYFLAWNISAGKPLALTAAADEPSVSWFRRQWAEVRAHRRKLEARMLALAIYDAPDPAAADEAFRREMAQILK